MTDEPIPAEVAEVVVELERIYGSTKPPSSMFWLMPFPGPTDMAAFLRTVQAGAGDSGIRSALEKHFGAAVPPLPDSDRAPGA